MSYVLEYRYKPRVWVMRREIAFWAAVAIGWGLFAITNDSGVINTTRMKYVGTVEGATAIYWEQAAITVIVFILPFVFFAILGAVNPMYVRLTPTELSAPRSMLALSPTVIPVAEIEHIEIGTPPRFRILFVYFRGKEVGIPEIMLPSSEAFEELLSTLEAMIEGDGCGGEACEYIECDCEECDCEEYDGDEEETRRSPR